MRDFWEPGGPSDWPPSEEAGQATVKMPKSNPLRLFATLQQRLVPAGVTSTIAFASAGDGHGGSGGVEPVRGGSDMSEDVETPATRGRRGDQGNIPAGRQRTVHFQPEDRYWTDYLRIALPVIGLVLMLGLFWYWASTFIGGSNSNEPVSTQTPGQAVIGNTASSPTAEANVPAAAKTPVVNTGTQNQQSAETPPAQPTKKTASTTNGQTGNSANQPGDNQAGDNQAANNQQATQPASSGGGTFAEGDTVTVTTDGLNMRDSPSTTGAQLTQLSKGDKLTILAGPEQGDNYSWYQVQTADGTKGWVASDFIQK